MKGDQVKTYAWLEFKATDDFVWYKDALWEPESLRLQNEFTYELVDGADPGLSDLPSSGEVWDALIIALRNVLPGSVYSAYEDYRYAVLFRDKVIVNIWLNMGVGETRETLHS
jgi:hypothetical protein